MLPINSDKPIEVCYGYNQTGYRGFKTMTPDELKALRRELGMTQEDFGEWLAREVNALEPDRKQVSAYNRQRISALESGDTALPDRIKLVLAARRIAELERKQTQSQRPRQKQK